MSKFVILIPGGFKPPTVAHYELVRSYETCSTVQDVYVIQTPHVREGFGPECTRIVFDWYGGFGEKVKFILDEEAKFGAIEKVHKLVNDPAFTSQYSKQTIYAMGAGDKGTDAKRVKDFLTYYEKRPGLLPDGVTLGPPPFVYKINRRNGIDISSTVLRKALRDRDEGKVSLCIPRSRSARNFPEIFPVRSLK